MSTGPVANAGGSSAATPSGQAGHTNANVQKQGEGGEGGAMMGQGGAIFEAGGAAGSGGDQGQGGEPTVTMATGGSGGQAGIAGQGGQAGQAGAGGAAGQGGEQGGAGGAGLAAGSGGEAAAGASSGGAGGQTAAMVYEQDLVGTWHVKAKNTRSTLTITYADGKYAGTIRDELWGPAKASDAIDQISYDPATRLVEFRRVSSTFSQWFRVTINATTFAGRFAHINGSSDKPDLSAYAYHTVAWNQQALDAATNARVYDMLVDGKHRHMVRLDAAPAPEGQIAWFGTHKRYSSADLKESLEVPIEVIQYDQKTLSYRFTDHETGQVRTYKADIDGRKVTGTVSTEGEADLPFVGTRANVLTVGLRPRTPAERAVWQQRMLTDLLGIMATGLGPTKLIKTEIGPPVDPTPIADPYPKNYPRDDDPESHPQDYKLFEVWWDYEVPNPYGGPPTVRPAHGWLSLPNAAPPPSGYPIVLLANGHGDGLNEAHMSAKEMTNPNGYVYWYGESYARFGYAALRVDISHRPQEDKPPYSTSYEDPTYGNPTKPSIKSAPFADSDWEEDAERAWDMARGLDFLLASQLPVNPNIVVSTGVSLGGEVALIHGAFDPRVSMVVSAGYYPDINVMRYHPNHRCYAWSRGDIYEYIDSADFGALLAPRTLLVETGLKDFTFAYGPVPFANDKQQLWRTRVAYGDDAERVLHYVHPYIHVYKVGDKTPAGAAAEYVTFPALVGPTDEDAIGWQSDKALVNSGKTLYQIINDQHGIEE